ncbi:TonB-dependent SusC/RagA subfamily outer membrane receptor [Flavobacterium sp. 270]|uniref:alpha-2-macroglobulin family protein n=1 Tax=Flavobacterium sp. 270 TaxID=2512114 RepID=UPI001066CB81|nr:alpha-2-macroglobulin family protein [Flavobacterium sp. 270]TDW47050.1 TonB-dependent SusC/RagA subfamily outer membrane receptor [Flavobacterium sp. 270]
MKKILFVLLLFSVSLLAQHKDKKWEKVIAYENEGKIKSANEVVAKIYKKAVSKKDEVQMIKCFFYQSKYLQVLDENARTLIISNLKKDIARVSIPSKAILNLVYARYLKDYGEYDYVAGVVDSTAAYVSEAAYDSTAVAIDYAVAIDSVEVPHSDYIPYKNASDNDIALAFEKTLENEAILKATLLSKYEAIFNFPSEGKPKNETLWDYLIKENITFYTEKIQSWNIQDNDFLIYKEQLFGNSEAFLKLNLDFIKDENIKKTLSLYQKIELGESTLENQFLRAKFCHVYLIKSNDYFKIYLEKLEKEAQSKDLLQDIKFEKATILIEYATKESFPNNNIEAVALLDEIIKINDSSNTAKLAATKKRGIISKYLTVQLQRNNYENENTRAHVAYKNVNNLMLSFYKINHKQSTDFYKLDQLKIDSLVNSIISKQNKIASKNYDLVNKKDYYQYSTDVLLPNLETGNYLVYFESDSDSKNQKAFGYQIITITNISVLVSKKNLIETYQVLNRKTGKPLENVTVEALNTILKTDSKGQVSFKFDGNNAYNAVKFSQTNDTVTFHKSYIPFNEDYNTNEKEKPSTKVQFYLDRAIYRPGQTVYYKGIAFQKNKTKTNIIANNTYKVTIQDSNYQIIKEFEAKTNEYGSFSGEFILSKSGITGNYFIKAQALDKIETSNSDSWDTVESENPTLYFKVEEYKRPKFEVTFDAKKESFQLNQSAKIKGEAKAFAGSNISEGAVKYTVTRYTTYLRNYYGREENQILTTGETKTDASGKFVIDFTPLPPKNNKKEQLPIFNYEISATVTDINGETHSAQTTVKIGYHDLILNAQIPNTIETKNKNEVILNSTNLNGEFLAAKGEVKLYFLSPFSTKFKTRIFDQPDIKSIPDADFEKLFPYEITDNEISLKPSETLLFSKKIDTQKDKKLVLDFISNYKSGNYKIVFSALDSFNNPIETTSNFTVKQSKDKFNPSKLITVEQLNSDPKKDGFVLVKLSSPIPELYILTNGNYDGKIYYEDIVHLQNNEIIIKVPVKNEFEQNLNLVFESVFENDSFSSYINVFLPTQEPKLEWTVESFRNKIQPGSTENWSFKLNGIHTKTESEVLASMYDSSLDQFSMQNWNLLKLNNFHYNNTNYKTKLGFDIAFVSIENLNETYPPLEFRNTETKLNWFGFNFYESRYGGSLGITMAQIRDKKAGIETIKGDPDAVVTLSEAVGTGSAIVIQDNNVYDTGNLKTKKNLTYAARASASPMLIRGNISKLNSSALYIVDGEIVSESDFQDITPSDIISIDVVKDSKAIALYGTKGANGVIIVTTKKSLEALTQVKARKNLSETAFFYPNLKTDSKGNVSFNFTSPEALTSWKLRLLAHNKDAVSGYLEKSVVTQKELMLLPNFPRFLREKDTIVISAKISNVTNETKNGIAMLQFFDAVTMEPIDAKMLNAKNVKNFTVNAFGNTTATWKIAIPEGLQGVQYKIVAKAGNFSDGEENILPVLTNNMLVTESIPIWVRENSKKEYTFENLKNNNSTTLKNHQFTLEYTSNPSWIAIKSLPYLMEYEHECAEQTFARFYANALASEIISSNPKIATVFENWRKKGKLNSKLEENEELKSIILAETPWFNDAQSEDEKNKNMALLFDLEKMKTSQESAFQKLKQKQKPSGAFAWFDGGNESEYITRHILAGLGHLSKLDKTKDDLSKIDEIAKTGIPYLDQKFLESYKTRTKNLKKSDKMIWINPNSDLHFLYARSFYLDKYPLSDTLKKAAKLYLETAKKDWLSYSLYEKGLATLTLNRFSEKDAAKKILESLKETSSTNEDWGMYWIANKSDWYWYQAPIETQALLIEAFAEINNDTKSVDAMKVWLLKNKQTKNWPSTKSTTEAIYALLMQGTDWLSVKDNTIIKLGNEKIITKKLAENEKEAETGYIKLNWKADEVKKEMASISIENKSKVPGFGGVYWQYFEDLDKIKTNSGAVLSVSKELYLKSNTTTGKELKKITKANPLKIGDLVTVRLIITSKEDMEFVHLKDMRASCFEPVNVLSEYQYKDGLGFYMSTKDAATHLFFDKINKGTYVIEYDIRVNNSGEFSNGITTIESMYAPEFTSHTKGIRVKVN